MGHTAPGIQTKNGAAPAADQKLLRCPDIAVRRQSRARAMATRNGIIRIRGYQMPTIPWSEITLSLWAILVAGIWLWIIAIMMLVCALVPSFRSTRLGRFFSNGVFEKDYRGRMNK